MTTRWIILPILAALAGCGSSSSGSGPVTNDTGLPTDGAGSNGGGDTTTDSSLTLDASDSGGTAETGADALPPGACAVPDRGAGTFIKDGWYYCPGQPGGVTPEIMKCSGGTLVSAGSCSCQTSSGSSTDCFDVLSTSGKYIGGINCSYAAETCYACDWLSGCQPF